MRLTMRVLTAVFLMCLLFAPAFSETDGAIVVSVSSIEDEAFYGDLSLEKLVMNENVRKIGKNAFSGCENLKKIVCLSKDIEIDKSAFDGDKDIAVYCYKESAMENLAREKGFRIMRPIFFELECDTRLNGAVGLPVTWQANWLCEPTDGIRYIWKITKDGDPDFLKVIETSEAKASFTPEKAGGYVMEVTATDPETGSVFSKTHEKVDVSQNVYFGIYEQDGRSSTQDKLEWTVLDVTDGEALLITKKIIKNDSYFNPEWIKYKYTYWAESCVGSSSDINWWGVIPLDSMKITGITPDHVPLEDRTFGKEADIFYVHSRYWLNEIFYESAFTDSEKDRIILVHNVNEDNPEYGTESGPDSWDKVFFLSYSEMMRYMPTAASRKASMTTMAVRESGDNIGKYWWLRTSGAKQWFAMHIQGANGYISHYGSDVGHDNMGYRPCIRIRVGG